jgi:hypothetical protein
MVTSRWTPHVRALLIFSVLAVAFSWPLPLHLSTHLTGSVDSDAGVYVWNQWVFRYEVVERRSLPYFTGRIFSLTSPANLSLHNYTTFANLLALPLMGALGVVATFNLVYLLLVVLSAYAVFLLARHVTASNAEATLAGVLFAWSPVLVTRGPGHFSLVAAAPLAIFLLLLLEAEHRWRVRDGVLLGCVMAWAATTDVYYAVFCLLIAGVFGGARLVRLRKAPDAAWYPAANRALELLIVSMVGLVAALALGRGWRLTFLGTAVSIRGLYTPVLILVLLVLARLGLRYRPMLPRLDGPELWRLLRTAALTALVATLLLSPVLYALGQRIATSGPPDSRTLWRSSPQGLDLVTFLLPNPNHPLTPDVVREWIAARREGYIENVGSVPFVAIGVLVAAWRRGWRAPRLWAVLTIFFGFLAVGPFVHVAGLNTYIPGPWAVLRYLPVVGLARMPQRFSVLLMIGLAVLFALALRHLAGRRPAGRRAVLAGTALLLVAELLPAPRPLFAATIPSIYKRIAADPRPDVVVLHLPFGIRDGTLSIGNFTAGTQFYQTAHGKPIVGGYLSRVSRKRIKDTRRQRTLDVLIRLSANRSLPASSAEPLTRRGRRFVERANLGYVVIDRAHASEALVQFATRAFRLELLERDGSLELYRPARSRQ